MIIYKTTEEIELIKKSCLIVSRTHAEVAKFIKPGVKTISLDKIAEEFIRDHKAEPGFLGYRDFPNTLCISINSEVVHGIPSNQELKDGDIVSIDCGVLKNGFYGDSAYTFPVGQVNSDVLKLLKVTKEALYKGIENARVGKRLGDIGAAIQKHVIQNNFTVVREMVGHGLGRELHEDPSVPNYGKRGRGPQLKKGMVLAIEPMINQGSQKVVQEKDGWTVRAVDGKASAHYEHTIVITGNNEPNILSTFDYIEEVINNTSKN